MSNETTTLTIFADYAQFYLQDKRSEADLAEIWDERSVADLIAVGPGVVAVGTARNYYVPVTIRTLDASPKEDLNRWDHVAEASLSVPSGRSLIYGPTEWPNVARIAIEPRPYVVRVYYEGLESVSQNGLEGEDSYEVARHSGLTGSRRTAPETNRRIHFKAPMVHQSPAAGRFEAPSATTCSLFTAKVQLSMSKNNDGQHPRPAYYYRALESPTKGLLKCPTTPIAQGALGRCATSTPTP